MREEPLDIIEGDWTASVPVYDAPTGWEPTALPQGTAAVPEPIEYYPTDPYAPMPGDEVPTVQPASTPVVYDPQPIDEVYPVLNMTSDPVCNCIMAPCDCDGTPTKVNAPMPLEPAPPVDGPTKHLGGEEPPPILTSTGTGGAMDDETMKILGFPWYYTVGAGVGILLLLSMMDGDK